MTGATQRYKLVEVLCLMTYNRSSVDVVGEVVHLEINGAATQSTTVSVSYPHPAGYALPFSRA